ncbi:2-hydroxyacid dehydrogenase [Pinisolibacter sp.]|uniref:2-hydroxyacid dehydrogenase n=1 Tax=Pinisolibacter sp. TaxID=2172024 RepID=UPI002FDCDAF9
MQPKIVFHGENASSFAPGFAALLDRPAEIRVLPDALTDPDDIRAYAEADVIVGVKFDASLPRPERLSLFHVPGAGYDAVDLAALPAEAAVCNCFGHEQAIAEYVFAALLARHVPLATADADLRRGVWSFQSGAPARLHPEMAGKTIGLLGYGHIGKAIARRAKVFDMEVVVANRSSVATGDEIDLAFTLDRLDAFWSAADFFVVSVPATRETAGMVDAAAFAAMRPHAVIFNVGRGATIDERALYEALREKRIGGAVIDTWWRYPSAAEPAPHPSNLPFHELSNIVMTPHMSGWTEGTVARRRAVIADNVVRRLDGCSLVNVVRPGLAPVRDETDG